MQPDTQAQYFELERQLMELESAAPPPRDRLERRLALHEQRLALLPEVTFQQGTPYAQVLENPYPWDIGAPLPHVLSDGLNTYLAYIVTEL